MCGRYFFGAETERDVEMELGLKEGFFTMSAGDINPAMSPKVITAEKGGISKDIRASEMFWGLTGKDKKLIINARSESVTTRSMFSDSFEHRRCIIPAAGFYEWDRDKNKVTFFKNDKRPIYLAGFYQLSDNRDSFVILTTAANESMIKVHDRMPLMIGGKDVRNWLYDNSAAKEMLSMQMPLLESSREYEQLSLF